MLEHRRVDQHLGIRVLVPVGQLQDAVQHQHAAVGDAVEHLDVLEVALPVDQRVAFEMQHLLVAGVQGLPEGAHGVLGSFSTRA
ncbi:MAG: hypothetical protein U5L06_06285 [Rhodovibrio sp.]|nr:hypothetical protein [Rhodovibrio sp.]